MLNAQLNEQDKQNISAQVDFDIRRQGGAAVEATFSRIGEVFSRNVIRSQESENVTDSKVRLKVSLLNVARIPPRETYTLAVEVHNVDQAAATLSALVRESQGLTVESHIARRADGSVVAKQVIHVPLAAVQSLLTKCEGTGTVRVEEAARNPQVPATALAVARLDVTLSNEKLLVPSDNGLWPQMRQGLVEQPAGDFLESFLGDLRPAGHPAVGTPSLRCLSAGPALPQETRLRDQGRLTKCPLSSILPG